MTDPNATPADEQTATLLVDRTSSTCGGCGKPTLPSALTHANVSGYDPKPGGGCGARFVAIRSANRAVTEEELRSLRPDLPVDTGREQQMTDRPYTDDDLRTLASRVHEAAARDSDDRVNSAVKRKWGAQLDADQLDEAGDELITVLDRAANLSRWAVDLGADGLEPAERTLTSSGEQIGFRVLFAFNPGLTDGQRNAVVNYVAHLIEDCDCDTRPTQHTVDPHAVLSDLAGRWERMADQGDTAVGQFEGPAAATLNAEVGERGRIYRKAAADVREALRTGRIPRDLLTPAELDALPDDSA